MGLKKGAVTDLRTKFDATVRAIAYVRKVAQGAIDEIDTNTERSPTAVRAKAAGKLRQIISLLEAELRLHDALEVADDLAKIEEKES